MSKKSVGALRRRLDPRDVVIALLLLLASTVFVVEQVSEHERMSVIDEYQYIDNFSKVLDHGIVRTGEKTSLWTRHYAVCHGWRVIEWAPNPEACSAADAGGEIYPLNGGTTGDLYTPVYFGITRVLAQPLVWAGVDLVDAGRTVGIFWLFSAAIVLYAAMRRLGVGRLVSSGTGLLLIGSGPAYWSTTYISTDAPALLAGSVAFLLATAAYQRHRWALVALPFAAAFFTLAKVQNLVVFMAVGMFLLLASFLDDPAASTDGRRTPRWARPFRDIRVGMAVLAGVAGVAAQAGWLALRSHLALGPGEDDGVGGPFSPSFLIFEFSNFLPRLASGGVVEIATGDVTSVVQMIGQAVTLTGLVGLAVTKPRLAWFRPLAVAAIVTAVLAAPALALSIVVSEGEYFRLPWRYGMTLFPWALACFALLVERRSRIPAWSVAAVGVLTWAMSLMFHDAL